MIKLLFKAIVVFIGFATIFAGLTSSTIALGQCLKLVKYQIVNECSDCREAIIQWCSEDTVRKYKVPALGVRNFNERCIGSITLVTDRPCKLGKVVVVPEPAPRPEQEKSNREVNIDYKTKYEIALARYHAVLEMPTLLFAFNKGESKFLEALLAAGADPNAKNMNGRPLLHIAIMRRNAEIANILLKAGANPNSVGGSNRDSALLSALLPASQTVRGRTEIIKKIASATETAGKSESKSKFKSQLEEIIRRHHPSRLWIPHQGIELLLSHGADPNWQNQYGETPFHHACVTGEEMLIETLLDAGANPNMLDLSGQTPLDNFVTNYPGMYDYGVRVVKLILNAGGNPCLMDQSGIPLYESVHSLVGVADNLEEMRSLLQCK